MQSVKNTSIPLGELKAGERAVLHEILAGRGMASRMSSLGFTPGAPIEMIQNYGHGPIVVTIRGTRVALGRHEANRTFVHRSKE